VEPAAFKTALVYQNRGKRGAERERQARISYREPRDIFLPLLKRAAHIVAMRESILGLKKTLLAAGFTNRAIGKDKNTSIPAGRRDGAGAFIRALGNQIIGQKISRLRPACDGEATVEKRAPHIDTIAGEKRFWHGPYFYAIVAVLPLKQQPPAVPLGVARLRKNLEWAREENIVTIAVRVALGKAARLHNERGARLLVAAPIGGIPLAFIIITSRPLE
jgi:hypothetical protein